MNYIREQTDGYHKDGVWVKKVKWLRSTIGSDEIVMGM